MKIEELSMYEVLDDREISELSSAAKLLRHKKTGARVVLLSNEDENKVFYIGFRTPPKNSTGVAHILEHSVLCGSAKYPVKDPFVELVKGSLNTFLNAMTYPDKTVYPVASCNDTDFQNLMDVYLDAVFHPNIYENESIFRQEGWHYEKDEEGNLFVNGVVYNEMKGALSSPDDQLEREIMNSLYPDTSYSVESGGDPLVIPELSYEEFLDFHRAYYHPSNSYIYLYGNMDMVEKLEYIDREYLSKYDNRPIDSTIGLQTAFDKQRRIVKECSINEGDSPQENTFLSYNVSLADSLDQLLYVAFEILDYSLCSAPGAPLKQALVEKGIGSDIYSLYENGIRQPYFSVVAKDTTPECEAEFIETIQSVLKEQVKKGIDKKALYAAINHYEFQYREADFGAYPKGLMYGLQALDSWLYDEMAPFSHIQAGETYKKLRELAETDYFEKLVEKYLLNNPHSTLVLLLPKVGLEQEREQEQIEKMAALKASLSEAELSAIDEAFEELRGFQEREDTPEDLARIPLLSRGDLKKEAAPFHNEFIPKGEMNSKSKKVCLTKALPMDVLYHPVNTNGIGYTRLVFKMNQLPGELYPYAALLKGTLGMVSTASYSYGDLNNELNLATGGWSVVTNGFVNNNKPDQFFFTFEAKAKYLEGSEKKAYELLEDMLLSSDFSDTKRLEEIYAEARSQMQGGMMGAGHQVATARAAAYMSSEGRVAEELNGVAYYRFLSELVEHFEEKKETVVENLKKTAASILRPENLMLDYTGSESGLQKALEAVAGICGRLNTCEVEKQVYCPEPFDGNEGLVMSGQVNYVCRSGNFLKQGIPYSGALKVLRVIMGYQYLWVNVRVKGGAYGCMSAFGRTGNCYFVSYRDPNLEKTIEVFENAPKAIAEFDADERTMTQFIIGTVSDLDVPKTPSAEGTRSYMAYMTELSYEQIQSERDEVLNAQPSDIKALAKHLSAFLGDGKLCVVGNSASINGQKELFDKIENLF